MKKISEQEMIIKHYEAVMIRYENVQEESKMIKMTQLLLFVPLILKKKLKINFVYEPSIYYLCEEQTLRMLVRINVMMMMK